jgi:ABC-type transporter Mla subunit MlaD
MNDLDITKLLETAQSFLEQLSNYTVVGFFIFGIAVLTILAFMSLIRVRGFYQREQTQLHILEKVLENLEQQPIETVGELRNKLFYVFQRRSHTLVYERIRFVLKLAENGKLGRIQAAAETMPPKKIARQQSYFAHFVISVLLIIGLAGTLWAFEDILIQSGLSHAIQGNEIQIEEYTPAIKNIYDGLQSAMLASLAGIFGTVFLLFVKLNWVQPVQERFFSHLDWITEYYLIPICSQFEKREVEQTLLHATDKLAQVVDGIQNISEAMQSNVKQSNSLAQELNAFAKTAGKLALWFDRATNDKSPFYQASTQLFRAVEAMGENYNRLTNRIDELVTEHNKSVSRYETYLTHLQETQKGFTDSQKQLVAGIRKIPDKFQKVVEDYAVILQMNKRFVGKLGDLTENLETQQTNYTDKVKNAAKSMTASLKGVNDATAQLEGLTTAVNQQAQSLIPALAKLGVDPLLHQYVDELKKHLIRTQDEFIAMIQQQQERMLKEFNQMESLKQIEQSVKEMHDLLKDRQKSWSFSKLFNRD